MLAAPASLRYGLSLPLTTPSAGLCDKFSSQAIFMKLCKIMPLWQETLRDAVLGLRPRAILDF